MSFKEYINESPVGMVGRTGKQDACDHICPELEKRFASIVKELGGKTVAAELLSRMNSKLVQSEDITSL